ncbi:haloalkane dehalogenase [Bradyrhizobium sp. CSA207]|uniref:haloalkane dehalogenase n=1 Tax=Bradyrhizobium sp. CSA207 TaxID=2698826 RepID=UPI0023AF291B|nr:haloalkane dehalogenase [Bradyrhizobium sp. CSA207]MDE5444351.1 haloalkane dehalogenase [Bradyrhizobium sp. CSA207]
MNEQPLPKQTANVLGKRMAYYDGGTGTPIVFLHGNPTSSYVWRNVVSELRGCGRLIAPDLIGMGDSEKLPNPGPDTYSFETQRQYLWSLLDTLVAPTEKIILVIHDWGSVLGFDWAHARPDRVLGIAYMEGIVRSIKDWSEWNASATPVFQGFRSEQGEEMVLDKNLFIERVLPGSILRKLSDSEMAEYRKPFMNREDRWPMLSWPRQLPIAGEPVRIVELVDSYSKWMSENDIPKLFVNAEPGAVLTGQVREFCRKWKNQTEVTVKGAHFIQEDSGREIGDQIRAWINKHALTANR